MTEKELVKTAFKEAEDSLRDKQKEEVKKIVKKTLEKLDSIKKEIKELREQEKLLELDIDDLKEGKLDRIVERQETDPKAKAVSVVIIIKEKETIREVPAPYWYWPYTVYWQDKPATNYPKWSSTNIVPGTEVRYASSCQLSNGSVFSATADVPMATINCSVAKDYTPGCYVVNGTAVNLR